MLSEDFEYILNEYYGGKPDTYDRPSEADLASWKGKVPDSLIDFWAHCGWCSFNDQAVWMPNPADFASLMPIAFGGDPQIEPAKCHLIQYDAFGSFNVWSEQWDVITVNIDEGWVSCPSLKKPSQLPLDQRAGNVVMNPKFKNSWIDSVTGKSIWKDTKKKLGALKPGECYGYAPLRSVGMGSGLDTVKKGEALASMAIAVQMGGLTLTDWEGYTMVNVRTIGSN